jgi:glycosyltransferase involved in cell wall biosynthesis
LIKVIAILTNAFGSGGGVDQALNAVIQMQRLSFNRFDFEVFTTQKENSIFLSKFNIKSTLIKIGLIDRLLAKYSQDSLWQSLQLRFKLIGPLEKKLIKHGCDVVYFVSPSNLCAGLQQLNYINTLWDLCHRSMPEFPEVRSFNTFFIREDNYKHNFGPALITLTDSKCLSNMASQYYGVELSRFLAMPFSPTPYLDEAVASDANNVLEKYNLKVDYFFYPAQFWAHKNHIRILQALKILRDTQKWTPNVVFSGKDYGNLSYIKKYIKFHQLESQVTIVGFVPAEDLLGLYKSSIAVIMPTYFGPTNLPPIEAWLLGKPLIYSSHLAKQVSNAALLVDPDKANELADAMLQCLKLEVRNHLANEGHQRLAHIASERMQAEKELCSVLDRFAVRRQCWE